MEQERGCETKAKLEEVLPIHSVARLTSTKTEKFGRRLVYVILSSGESLGDFLIKEG